MRHPGNGMPQRFLPVCIRPPAFPFAKPAGSGISFFAPFSIEFFSAFGYTTASGSHPISQGHTMNKKRRNAQKKHRKATDRAKAKRRAQLANKKTA